MSYKKDKINVDRFLKSVKEDIKSIKFEETETEVRFKIGNFFISRPIGEDYNYAVKKLFEDFLTNTSSFYIKHFWEK